MKHKISIVFLILLLGMVGQVFAVSVDNAVSAVQCNDAKPAMAQCVDAKSYSIAGELFTDQMVKQAASGVVVEFSIVNSTGYTWTPVDANRKFVPYPKINYVVINTTGIGNSLSGMLGTTQEVYLSPYSTVSFAIGNIPLVSSLSKQPLCSGFYKIFLTSYFKNNTTGDVITVGASKTIQVINSSQPYMCFNN